jgi:hypothetical protein
MIKKNSWNHHFSKLPEILPTFENIGIELEKLLSNSAELPKAVADYLTKFVFGATSKIMFFITKRSYIDSEQGVVSGSEPCRVLNCHLGK